MEKEGLDLEIQDGYLSAKQTSLGGDDGIAVAYSLALLASTDIPHPPLEAVFTVDEEIGMLGAAAIDLSDLNGKIMLNMDSEDEGIFLAGCAGGASVRCDIPVTRYRNRCRTYTHFKRIYRRTFRYGNHLPACQYECLNGQNFNGIKQ